MFFSFQTVLSRLPVSFLGYCHSNRNFRLQRFYAIAMCHCLFLCRLPHPYFHYTRCHVSKCVSLSFLMQTSASLLPLYTVSCIEMCVTVFSYADFCILTSTIHGVMYRKVCHCLFLCRLPHPFLPYTRCLKVCFSVHTLHANYRYSTNAVVK